MAMNKFRFACDSKKLEDLLGFALSVIVRDDLDRFDMPGIALNLDVLYAERGVGHEVCIEIDFLPSLKTGKALPIDFVVISYRDCNPGEEDAGLYAYGEFARGLNEELLKQSEGDAVLRERALRLIEKYDLKKYENI
ncbi:hypothetical protein [Variovorax sp. efr-133-TYG-130]|uniref:hypothetical protein n=1 Tax=Variovorax sp. efr-133-TYG-130 TaxID=3040327 RepID=UPI00255372BA|nr:hypothetical protein [Variovorax sp. efr-133-TYG-130]